MSGYTPRSGTFRKVKYGMGIYKEGEVKSKLVKELVEMAEKVKLAELINDECQVMASGKDDKKGEGCPCEDKPRTRRNATNKNVKLPRRKDEVDSSGVRLEIVTPEFTSSPVDMYKSAFPDDDSMPPFPVTTSADLDCMSDDGEVEGNQSDYDMDSEDEEWLGDNQNLNITPNRLEYIFTKLNKIDTHIQEKATRYLPASTHSDLSHLFPYWKRKRLQNQASPSLNSNFREQHSAKGDGKLRSGYFSTDPSVKFVRKVKKSLPQQPISHLSYAQKLDKREENLARYKKLLGLKEKMTYLRLWTSVALQRGLAKRGEIKGNMDAFIRRKEQDSSDDNQKENANHKSTDKSKRGTYKLRKIYSRPERMTVATLSAQSVKLLKSTGQPAKANKCNERKLTDKPSSMERVLRSKSNKYKNKYESKKTTEKVIAKPRKLRRRCS